MNKEALLTMSKAEYLVLAGQKYNELQALNTKATFYDYEKSFGKIWLDLGRQVLESNLGKVPADRRKKNDDSFWSNTNSY